MTRSRLMPRQPVPKLEFSIVNGGRWRVSEQTPENFTMVVVYRGLHCPICSGYLKSLHGKLADLRAQGVTAVAVSTDDEERATAAKEKWGLSNLAVGYGLSIENAREWGLYISSGIGKTSTGVEEPEKFAEPGLFLIRPDHTLYYASVQTMPFARPNFDDLGKAIDFAIAKDYPARGELA